MPKHRQTDPTLRYITRIDSTRYRGWKVAYSRGLQRPIVCYFGDAAYGGREAGLVEAKKFRDLVLAHNAPPTPTVPPPGKRMLKFRDKAPKLIGLRLNGTSDRYPRWAWAAKAKVKGRELHRSWSIRRHGYCNAFRLAARFRQEQTGQPIPEDVPAPSPKLLEWARLSGVPIDWPDAERPDTGAAAGSYT